MKKIKSLNTYEFAKFQALLTGLLGLLCGGLYSIGGFVIDLLVSLGALSPEIMETSGLGPGTALAFLALIGMPLSGIAIGFLAGITEALLYNLFAKWFGGFTISFGERE